MGKIDSQLSRMNYLMEFTHKGDNKMSNVAYHTTAIDGNIYGIIKEGTKYYIKTTVPGKETLAESYEYINGFMSKNENCYKSYNEATKQLELKLMSLNEAHGVKGDVSTVDMDRSKKAFEKLTEEARTELNRVHAIFENSNKIGIIDNIGNHGDAESKGKSTGANTLKNNDPFNKTASATLDKDSVATHNDPKTANKEYNDASKSVESELQSDKMKGNGYNANDYGFKDAHDDLDGDGVADKKPSGGKVVRVNEAKFSDCCKEFAYGALEGVGDKKLKYGIDDPEYKRKQRKKRRELDKLDEEFEPDMFDDADSMDLSDDSFDDIGYEDMGYEDADSLDDTDSVDTIGSEDDGIVGFDDEDDFDGMINELDSLISGDDESLTGPGTSNDNNSISMKEAPTKSPIDEDETQEAKQGDEETMKSYQSKGTLKPQCWDKMDECVNRITKNVVNRLTNESLKEKIARIVNEEVTRLNVWGQHPKYGKQPMTMPDNHEVLRGTADRDWNDDSAKGSERYGKKIGSSAPYDDKVEMLTDAVMANLKEGFLKKK